MEKNKIYALISAVAGVASFVGSNKVNKKYKTPLKVVGAAGIAGSIYFLLKKPGEIQPVTSVIPPVSVPASGGIVPHPVYSGPPVIPSGSGGPAPKAFDAMSIIIGFKNELDNTIFGTSFVDPKILSLIYSASVPQLNDLYNSWRNLNYGGKYGTLTQEIEGLNITLPSTPPGGINTYQVNAVNKLKNQGLSRGR